jgi:hypothetical protein
VQTPSISTKPMNIYHTAGETKIINDVINNIYFLNEKIEENE